MKINNKDLYSKWIQEQGKNSSYKRSIEILSKIVEQDIFVIENTHFLQELYQDLLDQQKKENSKYFHKDAPSYGKDGFYSASIKSYINFLKSKDKILENNTEVKKKVITTSSLNQILFGPPGTGKTYNTINKALEIIDSNFYDSHKEATPKNRKILKEKFEELKDAGQIEFVTFHQSYGYEEFVEGLKASTEEGQISYNVEDGIFKKLSVSALYDSIKFKDIQSELTYNELYSALVEKYKRSNYLELLSKEQKTIEIRGISKKQNLYCYHQESSVRHTVGKDRLKKLYDVFNSIEKLESLSRLHEEFTSIIGGANQTVYWTVLHEILQIKKELHGEIVIEEDISYEMKKEIIETQKQKEYKSDAKKYILIIDEINRGNISKIFGELITLIEPSKRIDADEEIQVQLPYSNETFGVPKNLYIIGTMNTADRSIALMDTALRRRFEFVEMMPKSELLDFEVEGIYLGELLDVINARVEYLYDRDHTIGHAYFMELNEQSTLEELDIIMRNKIIPLLQEYFYDDWKKILLILNNGFIQEQKQNAMKIFESIDDEYMEEEHFIYTIKDSFQREAYERLCHL